jgi:NhaP-type Na+/H+ or K+/H+ antiporter
VTTDQIYIGVSLTLALAVGCQVIGARLRIPALILLLPVGFVAGWLTDDVNPNNLLGASFQPLVSLAVAVILYDSGLGLRLSKLTGHTRRVVIRLLALGIPLTWALATLVAGPLLGMASGAAIMFGVILVVSGPTVVGPLLGFVRPTERVRRVLIWEGSLIDPVGGLLGAVVFHAVSASAHVGLAHDLLQFLVSVVVGAIGGAVGTLVLWLLIVKVRLGEVLGTAVQLATVVAIAGLCDALRDDTGLIAAIVMGLALANMPAVDMPARRPFFEVLVQLIIGVLFISISATVTPASLKHLLLPLLGLLAVLVLVARPLTALLSTLRTDLNRGERGFVGWMAPRGIVAAATASTFSAELVAQHIGGASKILPGTFLIIVATVTLYGLTAEPVARRLGVTLPMVTRPLLVGGDPWVIDLAQVLRASGMPVIMWTDSVTQRARIADAGLEIASDELIGDATDSGADIEGVTEILLLTAENGFNALAAALLQGGDGGRVYRVGSAVDAEGHAAVYAGGDVLFDRRMTRDFVDDQYTRGARIALGDTGLGAPAGHEVLFRIRIDGRLASVTTQDTPLPQDGDRLVLFGPIQPVASVTDPRPGEL